MGICLKHETSQMPLSLWESRRLSGGEGLCGESYRNLALRIQPALPVGEPPTLTEGGCLLFSFNRLVVRRLKLLTLSLIHI